MSLLKEPLLKLSHSSKLKNFVVKNPIGRKASRRFVAGETLDDAMKANRAMNLQGIRCSLDHLGENVSNELEASQTARLYLDILEAIGREKAEANISVKLTAMGLDIDRQVCLKNITSVLDKARDTGDIFVRLDMEGSGYTQITLDIFKELWEMGYRNTGVVLQSYLYRTRSDVQNMVELGARVRLCKGAYLEPSVVAYPAKADTDQSYIDCMELLLEKGNYPGLATHDEKIINHALDFVRSHKIGPERFEFQMLYGIRRDLQRKLVAQGYNVRAYVPYGSEWYPYLMRRMAERPANLFFIVSNFWRG